MLAGVIGFTKTDGSHRRKRKDRREVWWKEKSENRALCKHPQRKKRCFYCDATSYPLFLFITDSYLCDVVSCEHRSVHVPSSFFYYQNSHLFGLLCSPTVVLKHVSPCLCIPLLPSLCSLLKYMWRFSDSISVQVLPSVRQRGFISRLRVDSPSLSLVATCWETVASAAVKVGTCKRA